MCIFVVDGKEYTSEQHSLIGYTITGTEEYRSGKIKIFLELKNAPTKQ
jgi:hypothetical protein